MSRVINRFLYWIAGFRPVKLITLDGKPYLERYYLGQLGSLTFYLHRFVAGDAREHLHNHPWRRGMAFVLSGWYVEEVVTDLAPAAGGCGCLLERRRVGWFNRVDGNHFHRVAKAKPGTWTCFIHGELATIDKGAAAVNKGWGFLEYETPDVVYFRTFPSSRGPDWWLSAPIGRDANREPL